MVGHDEAVLVQFDQSPDDLRVGDGADENENAQDVLPAHLAAPKVLQFNPLHAVLAEDPDGDGVP